MRQASDMAQNIESIKQSIMQKECYLALAHTRLGNRCQRPGLELTRDLVEIQLVKEVHDLREVVTNLQETMFDVRKIVNTIVSFFPGSLPTNSLQAEASLRYLLKTQMQIEEDINVKTNTLKIDEVDCMTLRQGMDYHAY